MELKEAKEKFIQAWGTLGSNWGINRTMAQLHALLMVSPEPMSTDQVMEELNISRGNVNMNMRALIDWGLVSKVHKSGERMEYFSAEKDMWKVFRQVAKERRKREVEPIFKVLQEVSTVKGDKNDKATKEFQETIKGIQNFANKTDRTLEMIIKADENWFISSFLKLVK
jgi:DNA-binding transcriptional regulator GbsR (MarR family)